ncbi:hypothetical protein [Bittarella massiliensis (ex Durand et al. 2017)]|uniref:Uncharacterized protein n=1 Tax=Bittarella massiliensis (ex Durand et al. 2017) TaxID=1720313 RepID=A0ABW9WVF5_9FIRM|nr:hypothetical protein [Bittarella massiliensis (ex Durand et al. 2017)]MZL69704.1 hypothetical protein [Bittarella massiliensis (ex Durand et al. 2017)]MZL80824.1 hypothetical protein [Bittarella massiliensis (ex Durand et al. 2017)]
MRLIDADTVCKKLEGYARDCEEADDRVAGGVFLDAISEIQDAPTIDPKDLQPHGHWIEHPTGGLVCSHCHRYKPDEWRSMCCPNCGARMREEM